MKQNKSLKGWRWVITGMPLGGAILASFLPISRTSQQFLILIVLVWIQVFFIFSTFVTSR